MLIRTLREGDTAESGDSSGMSAAQLATVLESIVLLCQCLSSLLLLEQDHHRQIRTNTLLDIKTSDDDDAVDEVVGGKHCHVFDIRVELSAQDFYAN